MKNNTVNILITAFFAALFLSVLLVTIVTTVAIATVYAEIVLSMVGAGCTTYSAYLLFKENVWRGLAFSVLVVGVLLLLAFF